MDTVKLIGAIADQAIADQSIAEWVCEYCYCPVDGTKCPNCGTVEVIRNPYGGGK